MALQYIEGCIGLSSSSDALSPPRRMSGSQSGSPAYNAVCVLNELLFDGHVWLPRAGFCRAGAAKGSDGRNEGGLSGPDRRCGSRHD